MDHVEPSGDNLLTMRYVRLDDALGLRWQANPKEHDIPALAAAIMRHGFRDPSIYDATLGAIPAGNGRLEALAYIRDNGLADEVPGGIGIDGNGDWCVPLVFGADARSQAAAESFGVDHNNLTMAGFTVEEMARLWRREDYVALLQRLQAADEAPATVDDEDLSSLLALVHDIDEAGEGDGEVGPRSDGGLLSMVDITIDEPKHEVLPGDVWFLGHHVLVCADVFTGWSQWVQWLDTGRVFAPFAGPFVPLTEKGSEFSFVMVQPDPYIAGHMLDRYVEVMGSEGVERRERK